MDMDMEILHFDGFMTLYILYSPGPGLLMRLSAYTDYTLYINIIIFGFMLSMSLLYRIIYGIILPNLLQSN